MFTESVEKLVENRGPSAICTASTLEFHAVCTIVVRTIDANGTL
jgi:hypothetical protein